MSLAIMDKVAEGLHLHAIQLVQSVHQAVYLQLIEVVQPKHLE